MARLIQAIPVLVLLAVAVGSISVGTVVFADNDCEDECISNQGHSTYANSLSFDFAQPQMYDSCDVKQAPCIVIDPLDMSNEVFIADSALDSTKTLITLSALEQDNFPTQIDDIFEFPECNIITVANFDGINGILIECDNITSGVIDVTYSFTTVESVEQNGDDDDDDDDDDDED